MLDNIKPIQFLFWSLSLIVSFLLGLGVKALWELIKDLILGKN